MARPSGLGRGLGALIPSDISAADGEAVLRDIPVTDIVPNEYQPRAEFDEEALLTLSESIRELGVLQPILVRQGEDRRYHLIAGERRWRAARRAGLATVPAIVREVGDTASLEQALVENLHRVDLNALDEAAAYQQLIDDFAYTQEQIATRVGRSRSTVANLLRLLALPPTVHRRLRDGELTAGHARALLGSPDRAFQERLAARVEPEQLSVRAIEELIRAEQERAAGPSAFDANAESPAGATEPSPRGGTEDRPAGVLELEHLLAEHLQTRVRVAMRAGTSAITIDVADLADLERVSRVILAQIVAP